MPSADQSRLYPSESETFPLIATKINGHMSRQLVHHRQGIGIGLAPRRAQLALEDVRGHRPDAVKCQQALFQIARVTCGLMQAAQAAVTLGNEPPIAQDLCRFTTLVLPRNILQLAAC